MTTATRFILAFALTCFAISPAVNAKTASTEDGTDLKKLEQLLQEQASNQPAFTLNDAVSLYHKQTDRTHTYWNYLWLISIAAVTAAANVKSRKLELYILFGFIIFAIGNAVLINSSQKETVKIAQAIQVFLGTSKQPIDPEFKKVLQSISTWSACTILLIHSIIDLAVVYAVYKVGFSRAKNA
jgi:hypothetical protein